MLRVYLRGLHRPMPHHSLKDSPRFSLTPKKPPHLFRSLFTPTNSNTPTKPNATVAVANRKPQPPAKNGKLHLLSPHRTYCYLLPKVEISPLKKEQISTKGQNFRIIHGWKRVGKKTHKSPISLESKTHDFPLNPLQPTSDQQIPTTAHIVVRNPQTSPYFPLEIQQTGQTHLRNPANRTAG